MEVVRDSYGFIEIRISKYEFMIFGRTLPVITG